MNQKQLVFSLILAIVACFAFGWAMIIEVHPNPNKESKGDSVYLNRVEAPGIKVQ